MDIKQNILKYKNILGKDFKKKDEAYKYFRKKINEFIVNGLGYKIMTEETPIKQSEMLQLANNYASWTNEWFDRKTDGKEIKKWCVMIDDYNNYCLGFMRNEYKAEAVTAKNIFTCFGPGRFNPKEVLKSALRNEIKPQIKKFRESFINSHICALCNGSFNANELDVDHIYPFEKIANEFIELYGQDYLMKCLYKDANGFYYRLQDLSPDEEVYPDSPKDAWLQFHKERATLQMACKGCHYAKTYSKKII